ncbi:unnamed protein product [marine sediment metagenome]|uniref:Uncharacterized protein n=1 Tax=marine sediment metagenome TaxID=412755 RepID=X0TJN0_9ZZZZ
MSNPASDGIYLTKEYYENFLPTDLQWSVTKVDNDFTLYDLFCLVYQIEVIIPGICATFGMSKFGAFWDQINRPRDPDDIDDVAYLELYWSPEYDSRTTEKTGKPTDQKPIKGLDDGGKNYWDNPKICEMPNLMRFHGIGPGCPSKDYHECDKNCPTETPYGVEFSPINNLAHLPIRVSPKVEFYPPFVESDRDFKRTGFNLTIQPTLWCFITSIFWELTFAGTTPHAVANHYQEISNRMDEAKTHMKQINKKDMEEMV